MRKIFVLLLAAVLCLPAMAISPASMVAPATTELTPATTEVTPATTALVNPSPAPVKASDIRIPVATGVTVSLEELAHMKPSEFAKLRGKKMKLGDRISFWLAQKELRKSINADGTVKTAKLKELARADGGGGFNAGGFFLGFILGLIGVLIAYLINDDKKPQRTKWAWIGVLAWLVLVLLLVI